MIPALVYVLLGAHLIGDFFVQDHWPKMGETKSHDTRMLSLHVVSYGIVLTLALMAYVSVVWRTPVAAVLIGTRPVATWLVVNMAAHFVTDYVTSRINARTWPLVPDIMETDLGDGPIEVLCWRRKDPDTRAWFWDGIGVDQTIHLVTLFVTANWWLQ
jgi:hypothetical protein